MVVVVVVEVFSVFVEPLPDSTNRSSEIRKSQDVPHRTLQSDKKRVRKALDDDDDDDDVMTVLAELRARP